MSGFQCLECGRKFRTLEAAERASSEGCPKCGSVDVDLSSDDPRPTSAELLPGVYGGRS